MAAATAAATAAAAATTAVAALIPSLLFLLTLPAGASEPEPLRHFLSDLGLPRHRAAGDPCLISGISCELAGGGGGSSLRTTRISLPSLRLAGSISLHVGRLSDLRELSLPNNRISGELPADLSLCINLEVLNLRRNRFSGEIPLAISSLSSLRSLDLSSNRLSGDLRFLIYFPNLENLSLAHNFFSGQIPPSLSYFPNLLTVDLSGNPDLTGNKVTLNPHRRSLLYLPSNTISPNPSASHHSIAPAPGPSPIPSHHHRIPHKHKIRNWIIGFFIGSIAGILSGLVVSVIYHLTLNFIRGRYRNPSGPEIFSSAIKNREDLAFLENDAEILNLQVIGRGGSGEVYLKELPTTTGIKMIAIKRIRKATVQDGDGGGGEPLSEEESRLLDKWSRQIRSEIRTVGRIRHRNLLPLLAHVSRPTCHYLIYEYMKNGSLHDALQESADGRLDLTWPSRHRIAMGIAAGLEHLHLHHHPHVIHRDLKPGNILLDENMEARIADFGFAKEVPETNTHMTMSNIAGTAGYIAPEYYQTMKYTTKCDVYSFGVILAVMVMGRFPSDEFFVETEELGLVKWMRKQVRIGNSAACFDGKIAGDGEDEKMELALRVACFCTADEPKERPSSKEVRLMLAQISSGS